MPGDDFARPPPPPPLPLDDWLLRRDRADSYREPFFCGREGDYDVFRDAARGLARGFVGGETVIVQGAPGGGKSALRHECMAAVAARSERTDPWVAVAIAPASLSHPAATVAAIAAAARRERHRLAGAAGRWRGAWERGAQSVRGALAGAARRGGGLAGVRRGAAVPDDGPGDAATAFAGISRLCAGLRVVVFVDEAQNVPAGAEPVLDCMARGYAGVDLLPVFFGLCNTTDVLRKRGVSRPPSERIANLAPLSADEARASLTLAFDAYGMHGHARERWLDELTALSQGWPQHLNRIAVAAGRAARKCGMNVDEASLDGTLARGAESKAEYYATLLGGLPAGHLGVYKRLAQRLSDAAAGGVINEDAVRDVARAAGLPDADHVEWLADALHRGLLAPLPGTSGVYHVPLRSLAAHLCALPVAPSAAPAPRTDQFRALPFPSPSPSPSP